MPDSKISGLTSATTPLAGTEVLPIVQSGVTTQVSVANLTAGRSVDASTLTVTGNTYLATTSGNVGIGAIPTGYGKLEVYQSANNRILFSGAAAYGNNAIAGINDVGAEVSMGIAGSPVAFYTNATERMRIDSSGNVGINTSSPTARLHVVGTTQSVTGSTGIQIYGDGGSGYVNSLGANPFIFQVNTTERMRIDSAGNVGIGTSSPGVKLDVAGSFRMYQSVAAGYVSPVFQNSDATGYVQHIFNVGSNGANGQAAIGYAPGNFFAIGPTSNDTTTSIVFRNNNATERMRITAAGDVGIGTSSPVAKLDVAGAARVQGDFFVYGTGDRFNVFPQTAGSGVNVVSTNNANSAYAQLAFDGVPLIFRVAGTERMRITSAGDVGIGTSSPTNKLHIVGSGDILRFTNGTVSLYGYSDSAGLGWFTGTGGTNVGVYYNNTSSYQSFYTSSTERLRIDSSGNVGIGTSSPNARLEANAAVTFTNVDTFGQFVVKAAAGATGYLLNFGVDPTNTHSFIQSVNRGTDTAPLVLQRYGGNVGIGTTSPSAKLDVASAGSVIVRVQNTTTSADAYFQAQNTVATGLFGVNATGQYMYTAQSVPTLFYNAGAERMRIDSSGNLGLGVTPSAWAGYKPLQAGTGASFGGYAGDVLSFVGSNTYNDNTNWRYIVSGNAAARYQQSAGVHAWYTAPSGTAGNAISFTQAMTLDASGDLVIGSTTTNGIRLTAERNNPTRGIIAHLYNIASSGQTGSQLLFTQNGIANFVIGQPAGVNAFALWGARNTAADGTEFMRVDASGNLGIGTTTMAGKLNVATAGDAVQIQATNGTIGARVSYITSGVAYTGTSTSSPWGVLTADTERMRITAAGDVGIGTSSPAAKLHVSGAGTTQAVLTSTDQTTSYLRFINTTNNAGYVGYTSDNLVFLTGGTERLRITSAGNIHTPAGATTMTDGFIYIPAAAGAPSGAATAITGTVPLYYNSAGNTLYAYNTSWQAISGGLSLVSTNANGVVYLNASSQATTSTTLTYVPGTALTSDYYVANGAITGSRSQGAYAYGTLGYSDQNLLASYTSSTTSYNQMILQNTNAGASASTNLIVSNNLGTASTFYGEFGMNSSGFTGTGSLALASAVYLTATSSELVLGTTTANGLRFVVNSGATDAMRLTSAGNLGINTASPAYLLDVTTSARVTGGLILTGLATPGAPSGAGSTTGGSLAAATYYAKVIAIDVNGNGSVIGAESAGVTTTGSTSSIVWTWTAVAGAASYQLYFGTTSGTGYNTYFTTATNSYTLTTTAGASTNVFGQPSASAPGNSGSIAADGNIKGFNLQAVGTNPTGGLGALLWNGSNNANAISNLLFGNDTSIVVSGIYQYPSTATNPNELRISNGTSTGALTFHTNGAKRMEFPASGPTVIYTASNQVSFNTTTLYAEFFLSTAATGNWLMLRNHGVSATGSTGGVSNAGLSCLIFNNDAPGLIVHTKTTTAYPIIVSTADTERLRVTELGNLVVAQGAQSAQNTSATLTIAQIRTRIITANAAVTLTLPTGATLDTYCTPSMAINTAFEVTFIATAAAAITIGANGNTTVGSLTVAANTSGTYRFRKTAANTFTVYRL